MEYTLAKSVDKEDYMQGDANAALVVVEYGDYQCPYCGQAYPIVKQLQKYFGDKMAFVFRNFPLADMHPHAMHAAESAELAGDEGKFWEMHDSLYEDQAHLDDKSLLARAEKLGMDGKTFLVNLESGKVQSKVKDDFLSGAESGVNGTPSFYINGLKYEGSWEYEPFKQYLEEVLNA